MRHCELSSQRRAAMSEPKGLLLPGFQAAIYVLERRASETRTEAAAPGYRVLAEAYELAASILRAEARDMEATLPTETERGMCRAPGGDTSQH